MIQVHIRLSVKEDIPSLVFIDHTIWNDKNAPGPVIWRSPADYARVHPPGSQLVAVIEGTVCGYVSFRVPTPLQSNQHVVELALGVDPQFRRQGVGRKLLEEAERWAGQQGKFKLSLRVMATNDGAVQFYQACGFQIQGRLIDEFYLNGSFVDDILMYKWISRKI